MTPSQRALRVVGSATFLLAGLAYVFMPPVTATKYLESWWPAAVWGILFATGGAVSIYGILSRYVQVERFGLLIVLVAAACLTMTQTLIMFDGPTWTRAGGTLVYAGYTIWAIERWTRLAPDEQAIRELTDKPEE